MSEWISVKDRLPKNNHKVLILLDNGIIEFGRYIPPSYYDEKTGNTFFTNCPRWDVPPQWRDITHWMHLPLPNHFCDHSGINISAALGKNSWMCLKCNAIFTKAH